MGIVLIQWVIMSKVARTGLSAMEVGMLSASYLPGRFRTSIFPLSYPLYLIPQLET